MQKGKGKRKEKLWTSHCYRLTKLEQVDHISSDISMNYKLLYSHNYLNSQLRVNDKKTSISLHAARLPMLDLYPYWRDLAIQDLFPLEEKI